MGHKEEEKERKQEHQRFVFMGLASNEPSSDENCDVQACLVLSEEMKARGRMKLKTTCCLNQ